MTYPNKKAFKKVCANLGPGPEGGMLLTFTQVGEVFGPEFYELLVFALMDAQNAARAIQGAINRLSSVEREGGITNV